VSKAKLPVVYESARAALAECYRVDECKDWADKAAALASYAKQAQDQSLYEMAAKIHGRAIKRVGELLAAIEKAHGANQNIKAGAHPNVQTRKEAGKDAHLSEHQQKQALRVAAIPDGEFEELIEQSPPPTVTALAERGKKPAPKPLFDLGDRSVVDFKSCTEALGVILHVFDFVHRVAPDAVVRGASKKENDRLQEQVPVLLAWLNDLLLLLREDRK
jgi:hypothetical protein